MPSVKSDKTLAGIAAKVGGSNLSVGNLKLAGVNPSFGLHSGCYSLFPVLTLIYLLLRLKRPRS